MPNWCNNTVEIRHDDPAMLERVRKGFAEGKLLQEFLPVPQDLIDTMAGSYGDDEKQKLLEAKEQSNIEKYGYKNWYDWSVANWGTKWNAGGSDNEDMIVDYDEDVDDTGIALFTFSSAWAPPVGVYEKLKELHPDLYIQGRYYEPGVGFFGVWDDGEDRCYDFESITKGSSDEFWKSEDGILLDENFDIVEDMIRNEEYEKIGRAHV